MKNLILVLMLLISTSAVATEVCTNEIGSISYDTKTIVGNSAMFENPFFVGSDGRYGRYASISYTVESANGLCTLLGYTKSTSLSSVITVGGLMVGLSSNGEINFAKPIPKRVKQIGYVTCSK